jgi:hypothetical protein
VVGRRPEEHAGEFALSEVRLDGRPKNPFGTVGVSNFDVLPKPFVEPLGRQVGIV